MIDPQRRLGSEYALLARHPASVGGVVWLVRAHQDGSERVIKILHPELTATLEAVEEFSSLLVTVRRLEHPGILVAEEIAVYGNRVALIAQRMPGEDLSTLLKLRPLPTAASTALMVADLCDALAAAHAAGIVHGDVKPSNVLLELGREIWVPGSARLTDFGMAGLSARTGATLLPAEYQAPEIGSGRRWQTTAAADVYAVGVVLYEALVGRPPFIGSRPDQIARLHREARPPRLPELPNQLWLLIAACLNKDPRNRPTAAELAQLLREVAPTLEALPAPAVEYSTRVEQLPDEATVPTLLLSAGPLPSASPWSIEAVMAPPVEPPPIEPPLVGAGGTPIRGARALALAVFSGLVMVTLALALAHKAGDTVSNTAATGSATIQALVLSEPTTTFASAAAPTTTTATTAKSPSPTADHTTARAVAPSTWTAPTLPSPSTAPTTASAPPTTVTVGWQCSTRYARPGGVTRTACIGIGSDGELYSRGVFVASDGGFITDVTVTLADGGPFVASEYASCDASSCTVTSDPYTPPAGYYQVYAGTDDTSHEAVSPTIYYPGY
jgi:serine/threonine protein kinase